MARVSISSTFQHAVDGSDLIEIEATTIGELLLRIVDRYPKMAEYVDEGIAVAIDGEIYRDDQSVVIKPGVEVFLIPRIQGG